MAFPATRMSYARIGIILAILTLIEFGVLYVPGLKPIVIGLLVVLSIAKLILVVQFYMHLRFERRVLGWVFLAGIGLSLSLWFALWAIMYYRIPSTLP